MKQRIAFRLYLITDRKLCNGVTLSDKVEEALACGIKGIQLREKDLTVKDLLGLGEKLRVLTYKHAAQLMVNDRFDVALSLNADGLQIPEDGLAIAGVRPHFKKRLIARSIHSLEGAKKAEHDGADFITFGPIFSTPSKEGVLEPRGLSALEQVASAIKIPVFALGGITPPRAAACIGAGAFGVALISSILGSTDIPKTIREYESALGSL